MKLPSEQLVQALLPAVLENVPAKHWLHTVCPGVSTKLTAEQLTHDVAPADGWNVPGGHVEQGTEPVGLN